MTGINLSVAAGTFKEHDSTCLHIISIPICTLRPGYVIKLRPGIVNNKILD